MIRFVLALLVVVSFPASARRVRARAPEVLLVGAVHNLHFNPSSHYSLKDLAAQILSLKPDLICGEITPEALGRPMEGYFPPEAAFLAAMAPGWKVRFAAVDWRMDTALQRKAEEEEPDSVASRADRMDQDFKAGLDGFRGTSLYDYIHFPSTLEGIDTKFEQVIGENTVSDLAAGNWHERNRRIVENSLAAAHGARRIVIVFGVSHLPQLVRQLKARGIRAEIPARRFLPGGSMAVPPGVLARWRRNAGWLRAIREGKVSVSPDSLLKVRDSHRIQDLEQALEASGG